MKQNSEMKSYAGDASCVLPKKQFVVQAKGACPSQLFGDKCTKEQNSEMKSYAGDASCVPH